MPYSRPANNKNIKPLLIGVPGGGGGGLGRGFCATRLELMLIKATRTNRETTFIFQGAIKDSNKRYGKYSYTFLNND